MSDNTVYPDTEQSINFLQEIIPHDDWVLTAIEPDTGAIETRTLNPAQARVWINQYQGKRNIYYHVNSTIGRLNKKAEKSDIKAMRYFHIDLDYQTSDLKAEDDRILSLLTDKRPAGVPEPTLIIRSGGGYQALFRLITPIPINGNIKAAEDAERYNRQLEQLLHADPCHNADRVLRCPGTINIPNKKKLAKGRVAALATVVFNSGPDYEAKKFRQADPVHKMDAASSVTDQVKRTDDLSELDQYNVPPATKVVIAQGRGEDRPTGDNSRSGWLLWTVLSLVKSKVPDDVILGLITDPGWGISESVLEKKNVLKYAQRQISKAKEKGGGVEVPFHIDGKGNITADQGNIKIALNRIEVELSHDTFADRLMISGLPGHGPLLQDESVVRLWLMFDEDFGLKMPYDYFQKIIEDTARQYPFHPVRDYLDDLTWDGIPRINTWLCRYGEAADTKYTRAVGSIVLVAAVKRVRQPGCKFDEMLILESGQGSQKSTALFELVPNQDWFSDDLPLNADSKLALEQMAGRWIIEAADLKGLKKGDVDHIKSFLSRRTDRARMAYGRIAKDHQRQSIIIGTMNDAKYFRDTTGNRRFWPVGVGTFKLSALKQDRDQLWAEASFREAQGESIRLDPGLYDDAAAEQRSRTIEDPFIEILAPILGDVDGKLRSDDVWRLVGVLDGQRNQTLSARVSQSMHELGWRKYSTTVPGSGSTKHFFFQKNGSDKLYDIQQIGTRWVLKLEDDEVF